MADVTLTTVSDALKTEYLDIIKEQIDYGSNPLYIQIAKNSKEVNGGNINMAVQYGVSGGVGSISESTALPTSNPRKIKQVTYAVKDQAAVFRISDKAIKTTKGKASAFISFLEMVMKSTTNDAKKNYGRQLYTSNSGKLAMCAANSSTNDVVLDIATYALSGKDATKYLEVGMFVDIMATNNTVKVAKREITNIVRSTGTITISGAVVDTLVTDYIVISGSYGNELTGFEDIFKTTGSLYGLDRATYTFFAPYLGTSIGQLNEIVLQNAIDEVEDFGSTIDYMAASKGVVRAYQNYMLSFKKNIDVKKLFGGYTVLDYNGIGLVKDKLCPQGCLFGLATEDFVLHEVGDWEWMTDETGNGSVLQKVSGYPLYEAALLKYGDLGCRKPNNQFKLSGITEDNN